MIRRVLFVCLGNICRSPTAHGVFQKLVDERGLSHAIEIDSAGTGDWHVGRSPDTRTQTAARQRGYDLSPLRARQVIVQDFHIYDFILAMDDSNLADLKRMVPAEFAGHLGLFLEFARKHNVREVPDPYYGGNDGFTLVLDMVEDAAEGLLEKIHSQL